MAELSATELLGESSDTDGMNLNWDISKKEIQTTAYWDFNKT